MISQVLVTAFSETFQRSVKDVSEVVCFFTNMFIYVSKMFQRFFRDLSEMLNDVSESFRDVSEISSVSEIFWSFFKDCLEIFSVQSCFGDLSWLSRDTDFSEMFQYLSNLVHRVFRNVS